MGGEFGFPRNGIKKQFKWKKMNFITDLPKRDPLVRYIVASAVTLDDDTPVYRMHAIILRKSDPGLFIGGEVESD